MEAPCHHACNPLGGRGPRQFLAEVAVANTSLAVIPVAIPLDHLHQGKGALRPAEQSVLALRIR